MYLVFRDASYTDYIDLTNNCILMQWSRESIPSYRKLYNSAFNLIGITEFIDIVDTLPPMNIIELKP